MEGEFIVKKIYSMLFVLTLLFALAACNSEEEAKKEAEKEAPDTEEQAKETEKVEEVEVASAVDPRLQEPTEDTVCEMCNMVVYQKDHEMGKFSAQAIKADGSIAFYDDIGCLLNAELAHNETNEKFVRDFNTLEWVLVDNATIVKTDLKTPMNWGYAFFKEEADAQKFIDENEGYKVVELETVKQEAKERREAKLKKQAEQQGQGNGEGMQHGQH